MAVVVRHCHGQDICVEHKPFAHLSFLIHHSNISPPPSRPSNGSSNFDRIIGVSESRDLGFQTLCKVLRCMKRRLLRKRQFCTPHQNFSEMGRERRSPQTIFLSLSSQMYMGAARCIGRRGFFGYSYPIYNLSPRPRDFQAGTWIFLGRVRYMRLF